MIFIIAYCLLTTEIRAYVNSKCAHPYYGDYNHTPQPFKVLHDLVTVWWNGRIMQRKLIVDMRFYLATPDVSKPNVKQVKSLERRECWTDLPTSQICQMGYLPAKRLHDTIPWVAIPVYLRFDNPQKFEVPETKDEEGHYVYSQDSPSTLYDKWQSNATKEFIKSLSKLGMRQIDTQTMIMMAIIGVGAVVGMWLLGIF